MAMPIGACFSAVVTLGEAATGGLGDELGGAAGKTEAGRGASPRAVSNSVGDRAAIALLYSEPVRRTSAPSCPRRAACRWGNAAQGDIPPLCPYARGRHR